MKPRTAGYFYVGRQMRTKEELMAAIDKMLKVFAPSVAGRWTYLLRHDPKRWNKISPIGIWPVDDCYSCYPKKTLQELIELPSVQRHMKTNAAILSCGHAEPAIFEAPLNTLLSVAYRDTSQGGNWAHCEIFEGFISIVPGDLVFLANHEGGYALLEHNSSQKSAP